MDVSENPVVVTFSRGGHAESWHRGAAAVVCGADAALSIGDAEHGVYGRSALKPLQAVAALESGIVERFGLDARHLAVLCASHNGDPEHVEVVRDLLARGGFTADDLRCGVHVSLSRNRADALVRAGESPGPLHNNCSGKHAGMLLACRAAGHDPARYCDPDHPLQRAIRAAILRIAECAAERLDVAVDGCSAPTFRLPLRCLAIAYRNLACPEGAPARDRVALARLRDAMLAHPDLTAGSGRFESECMRASREAGARLVIKIGAEGVIAAGAPAANVGIAIKIDDGAERAYAPLLVRMLDALGLVNLEDLKEPEHREDAAGRIGAAGAKARAALARWLDPVVRNHSGVPVGTVDVTVPRTDDWRRMRARVENGT